MRAEKTTNAHGMRVKGAKAPAFACVAHRGGKGRSLRLRLRGSHVYRTCGAGSRGSASLLANENNLTLGLGSAACFFDADGKRIGGFDGSRRMETRTNETVIGD